MRLLIPPFSVSAFVIALFNLPTNDCFSLYIRFLSSYSPFTPCISIVIASILFFTFSVLSFWTRLDSNSVCCNLEVSKSLVHLFIVTCLDRISSSVLYTSIHRSLASLLCISDSRLRSSSACCNSVCFSWTLFFFVRRILSTLFFCSIVFESVWSAPIMRVRASYRPVACIYKCIHEQVYDKIHEHKCYMCICVYEHIVKNM